ncbi:BRD4-interacting chromatin-remodeling complex-associated protein-like isoform X2 [Clupea harengus]|uniref:BRD4-interacting chromatin-remodeling complex-associated protein-like isoform X2 n=1 Tax=Clupea harengus TaxID=7950 RepID=A0A8M1KSS7_CLUHA|nr:BRD4-interacting chromatin-remodeling complex-associated protein-like isoform X2 [Clupea harengus]
MALLQSFETEEPLTQAMRRHRIQLQLCSDHKAVLSPQSQCPFVTLEDAVRHLLPFHTCAGRLPSQRDFSSVDEQFEAASVFLFNRTKDMQNKYRQLLLAEAQQESPSAEMVMLERLFLQSERFALGEERRKARRDPGDSLQS